MTRRATEQYCAQHLGTAELPDDQPYSKHKHNLARVSCPLDPGHSIWLRDLQRHLKRCQATKEVVSSAWFVPNINLLRPEPDKFPSVTPDAPITFEEYQKWVAFVEQFYGKEIQGTKYTDIPLRELKHEGLERRLGELSNKKHAIQQGSLIATLGNVGLLLSENCFVEFGAGRGELSRYLHQALLHRYNNAPTHAPSFLLIDRSGMRMKLDSKIIKDAEDLGSKYPTPPIVHRIKTDIKDLDLRREDDKQLQKRSDGKGGVVAISKHLCGAATDLTIQCVMNYIGSKKDGDEMMDLAGIMIALCCRHRCSYSSYPLQYLTKYAKIDPRGFEILSKMSSWAVCGRRPQHRNASDSGNTVETKSERTQVDDDGYDGEHDDSDNECDQDGQTHISRIPIARREEIGIKVRSILDYGRVRNLEDQGFQVKLIRYVDKAISSENVCLLAIPIRK
ncbi:methyltransferase TRM13-domain-containing protein [Lipomyces orientalis]|uniref:Methyltransferase TRM13-domain-containing protein n=1 Tax=Lipomyces orientalis TaxID=1233043 RepID=A0ACC3TPB5_9ASCO